MFTNGPWEVRNNKINYMIFGPNSAYRLADICSYENTLGPNEAEAQDNARLIAAAPEMYEELKRINDGLPNVISDLPIDKSLPLARLCDRLTVLLSKIEGR